MGHAELDGLLTKTPELTKQIQQEIDEMMDPRGTKVSAVVTNNVILPAEMQKAIVYYLLNMGRNMQEILRVWKKMPKIYTVISIIALISLTGLFVIFTYYPPQLPIFQDPISRSYGIKE